ncbi:MAG: choice-of-anchor A family protein [Roseateles sp.]|uniref:choice-of-anchor A family protein n=1 Tax=Roseateles sp. TaxID=1971397 RepID=UPI0039EB5911
MAFMTLNRIAAVALLAAAGAAQAVPVIDFGAANGYSGFFFGNVTNAADVEGRLAVGGDLTNGFDIGYRNAYGSTAPSLVVGGNVTMTHGMVYNGPTYDVDTNATIGPSTAPWIPGQLNTGDIVYGGTLQAADWQYKTATKNANYLDFAAAKSQLGGLSNSLASEAANGSFSVVGGGVSLVGDGTSDVQVFNLGDTALTNLSLSNIKAGAHIVINSTLTNVTFAGDFGGDKGDSTDPLASFRDRIVFNLVNATSVNVNTFVNGSVLAVNAAVSGSGHLEGMLIADSLGADADGRKLEIGYEHFTPTSPVPEPQTYAMLMAGLLTVGTLARRRRQSR